MNQNKILCLSLMPLKMYSQGIHSFPDSGNPDRPKVFLLSDSSDLKTLILKVPEYGVNSKSQSILCSLF